MESPYATWYVWIIVTYVVSCTVSEMVSYWSTFRCLKGVSLFNAIVRDKLWIQCGEIWSPETINVPLSFGAKHISISWTVKAWLMSVTGRQTDRFCHNKCRAHLAAPRPNIWTVEEGSGCAQRALKSIVIREIIKFVEGWMQPTVNSLHTSPPSLVDSCFLKMQH